MISYKNEFIFIHIPKTGGNSIQTVLKNYSEDEIVIGGLQDGIDRFAVVNKALGTKKHASLSQYKWKMKKKDYKKFYKFSVIRNPYDRLVSYYFSPHLGRSDFNRSQFKRLILNINPARDFVTELSVFTRAGFRLGIHSKPRKDLAADIDYFLRFESLQDDFTTLCKNMGFSHEALPEVNRSKTRCRNYRDYYDDELRELVETRFCDELELGNYDY